MGHREFGPEPSDGTAKVSLRYLEPMNYCFAEEARAPVLLCFRIECSIQAFTNIGEAASSAPTSISGIIPETK